MAKKKKAEEEKINDELNEESLDDVSDADDSFGLPEVEFKPLSESEEDDSDDSDSDQQEEVSEENDVSEPEPLGGQPSADDSYGGGNDDDDGYGGGGDDGGDDGGSGEYVPPKGESIAPKLIAFFVILVIAAGAIWYFGFYRPEQSRKLRAQQLQEQRIKARQDSVRRAEQEIQRQAALEAQQAAEEAAAEEKTPETGTVDTISERTGRYYVVVNSFVDDDLAVDYANKLAGEGINTTLIPPYSDKKFYRLAIAAYGSFNEAQSNADQLKATYGDGLWVLKY